MKIRRMAEREERTGLENPNSGREERKIFGKDEREIRGRVVQGFRFMVLHWRYTAQLEGIGDEKIKLSWKSGIIDS